jgi:hypothetical protein
MSIKDKVLELLKTKCFWDEFDMRHIEGIEEHIILDILNRAREKYGEDVYYKCFYEHMILDQPWKWTLEIGSIHRAKRNARLVMNYIDIQCRKWVRKYAGYPAGNWDQLHKARRLAVERAEDDNLALKVKTMRYDGISMRDIAKELNISVSKGYYLYNKDILN